MAFKEGPGVYPTIGASVSLESVVAAAERARQDALRWADDEGSGGGSTEPSFTMPMIDADAVGASAVPGKSGGGGGVDLGKMGIFTGGG